MFGQVSIGIRIGPPPPVREVVVLPPTPGPEFVWVGGYWFPTGNHYKWHAGYWTRPAYPQARWVAPRSSRFPGGSCCRVWVVFSHECVGPSTFRDAVDRA